MPHVKIDWSGGTQDAPWGSLEDHFEVSLGGGVAAVTVPLDATEADFLDVPAGDYTGSVQLIGADGAPIGPPSTTATFSVHPDMISVHMAVSPQGSQLAP